MRIAVYGNSYQEEHLEELSALFELLSTHIAWVEIEASFSRYLCKVLPTPPKINDVIEGDDFSAAIALSLGGDGTFLRTAQWVGKKEIPILGINTGHLGYLADVRISDVGKCLECVFNGNHRIDSRTMIEVDCAETDVDGWPYALNEVAILKQDTSSMIDMEARIGDALLANYRGDGLIVSTPTGSTGYNRSVGGPILEPSAPVWAISPIAAHSLTMRPLVVSDDSVFTVTTHSRSDAYRLSLDGRSVSLAAGTTVMMRRAPFVTKVIQSQDHHFSDTLRDKLLWGIDKR